MASEIEAKYISVWDGGSAEIISDVLVDLENMEIAGWDWDNKEYVGCSSDDDVEVLDEEKVVTPFGVEYTAMSSDEYENFGRDDEDAYDEYGNGIIVYNA